jgi:hypothetical protein
VAVVTWLQFIVEFTKALAWPVAAVLIAIVLRHHLSALLDRIAEVTLPGGSKVVFRESLRKSADAVAKLDEGVGVKFPHENLAFWRLRSNTLSSGIGILDQMITAFVQLETLLLEVRPIIEKPNLRTPRDVAAELARQRLVSAAFVEAFENLRKARNAAVHIPDQQITPTEAIDFVAQAKILSDYLETLIEQKGKAQ